MPNIPNLSKLANLLKIAIDAKLFIVLVLIPLFSLEGEVQEARRIQAQLTIHDPVAAVKEARKGLTVTPHSILLHQGLIRALAQLGDEKALLTAWDALIQEFPEQVSNRELIEEMAWGILNKASHSSSLAMRQMSLLAAYFSQEGKGVSILYEALDDPNYAIRAVAVKLASHFRDQKLKEKIRDLFNTEQLWIVRQAVLEAVGTMKIVSLRPNLEALIASDESLPGEKALAIASLLEILETVNRSEIEKLATSNRAGLRQLACQLIAHFQLQRDIDQLIRLASDTQSSVRMEAYQALGQLRPIVQAEKIARQGIKDPNYEAAISAAWLLALYNPLEGQKALGVHLYDERREVRALAASAIAGAGPYGLPLAFAQFRSHQDPYVRLNLSLGLIGLRQQTQEVCTFVKEFVLSNREKWNPVKAGLFQAITNLPLTVSDDPVETPEIDNQLLRLQLINLLVILKTPEIEHSIRLFLADRSWEISATAAVLLLTEGDDSAIEVVKQLLQDSDPRVRLQAAFILSLWSREESAIQALEEGYLTSDRDTKSRILEGLGRIGSMRSVPFLINVLREPSQTLRLIAAMALIQCINH